MGTQFFYEEIKPFSCDTCLKDFLKSDKLRMYYQRIKDHKKASAYIRKLRSGLEEYNDQPSLQIDDFNTPLLIFLNSFRIQITALNRKFSSRYYLM